MNAKEARQLSIESNQYDYLQEVLIIDYHIKHAAQKGLFGIQVEIKDQRTIDHFKKEGYNVLPCINVGNKNQTIMW